MKSYFGVFLALGLLISSSVNGEGARPAVPTACNKICNEGKLDPDSCSCETNANPKPGRRIWPALDEADDDGVWDEDDEE